MRGQTLVPTVCACRLIRSRIVSQIAFEQVLHRSVWPRWWGLHPRAVGNQAPHLEIDPLRQLSVRHVRRAANLPSLKTKPHPPDWSSPIQSHGCPPFVWPCLDLIGVEPQEPPELQVRDRALLRPSIECRTLDTKTLRHLCDIQQGHTS